MKLLATSDIHQMGSKWKSLVKVCQNESFDIVAIAGDICPKNQGIELQLSFLSHLKKYAKSIQDTRAKLVFMLGNDDNQHLIPDMLKGHDEGLWIYIADKVIKINNYEFVGMPYVPDYPFGYKFWCNPEFNDKPRISYYTICEPCILDDNNHFKQIPNFDQWFKSKSSIDDILNNLAKQVQDIKKSIWLIHAPPSQVMLDVCQNGHRVGSDAVLKFITDHQPMLCIHGHIHESPEYNGHKWNHMIGNSLCVQGGQLGFDLHYSVFDIEDGKIKSKKHSIYE
jgi:Icc-related predicted phosphoesterase